MNAKRDGLYYGWVLVVAMALAQITSWGVLYYAFTVFLRPMQTEFGWSKTETTLAFSLAPLFNGVAGVYTGRWLDRHGPRLLMTVGSVAAAGLVVAWANVNSLAMLYLVFAGIGVVRAAVLYEPAFWVVAVWFRSRRGRALTVLTFVAGFASVIYIPLAGWLVERLNWRPALLVLALLLLVLTLPIHALLLRRRPEDLGLLPDGARRSPEDGEAAKPEVSITTRMALRGLTFWLLAAAFFLNSLGSGVIFVHFVPYLLDHGYSEGFAASLTGLIGILALPGRLVLTPLGDRIPRSLVAAAIFLFQTVALLCLLLVSGTAGVVAFVVLFGAGFGAVTPARAGLVAELYGAANYGSIAGVLALLLTGAGALAPVSAGIAYDQTGSYALVLWALVVFSLLSTVAVVAAERGHRA